jgi:hypothetical protein
VSVQDLILTATEIALSGSIAVLFSWLVYTRFYLPVPPNRALVLFGHRAADARAEPGRQSQPEVRAPRIFVGGGVFVAPWNKGVGHLCLQPVDVELVVRATGAVVGGRTSGWETRIRVQAKIPTDSSLLATASENLLGKSEEELRAIVGRAVESVVPSVLARWRPEPGEADWDRLASEIQASVAPDLVQIGMVVRSLFVTELRDLTPGESARPISAWMAEKRMPSGKDEAAAAPQITQLNARIALAERNLGIMGAEVERLGRGTWPSVFDIPLGYEGPLPTADSEDTSDLTHDSMGGERSPRSARTALAISDGEGVRVRRPLLDTEL